MEMIPQRRRNGALSASRSAPMNRARALIICTRPQDYAPTRVYAAASYLETQVNATAEELGLAKMAHLFLQQARRELPERKPAAEALHVKVQKKADRR